MDRRPNAGGILARALGVRATGAPSLLAVVLACGWLLLSCDDGERQFARAFQIETMAQTIGGPTASGRPGDYMLENDKLRAVINGGTIESPKGTSCESDDDCEQGFSCERGKCIADRHNRRSVAPLSNGSLVDLDIQRPHRPFGVGKGKDTFYELGPMVNLKVSNAREMDYGSCHEVGASACPSRPCEEVGDCPQAGAEVEDRRCARVTTRGKGDNIMGILGLLDLAIKKNYASDDLEMITDYDLCPGERFVRVTTRARFTGEGTALEMEELPEATGLLAAMLGEHSGIDCARQSCPESSPICDDLLISLKFGTLNTEMKRCRKPTDKLAGVLAGDFSFFSAKAHVFIPGNGFDHDTYVRSVFDSGGDIFSNPLALDFVAAASDGVSYAYFNRGGKLMIPVFGDSFTASMSNNFACSPSDPDCLKGKELVFRRFVSVGDGSVASALAPLYRLRGVQTGTVDGHVVDERTREPVSGIDVVVFRVPDDWSRLSDRELALKSYAQLAAANRDATRSKANPLGEVGAVSHFHTDTGLDKIRDGSFGGPLPVGRYLLVTRDKDRPASRLAPVTISAGDKTKVTLFAGDSGALEYSVKDSTGRGLPSKLTIGVCLPQCAYDSDCARDKARPRCDKDSRLCVPTGGYVDRSSCHPFQRWDEAKRTCVCPTTARLPLELGGGRLSDGTVRAVYTASGRGTVHLPPGSYQVIASRGMEYGVSRRQVTIRGGTVSRLTATLAKVIDTRGWVSADFHVHGPNSPDASLGDYDKRVISFAAEGVELLSSSDHDYLTDYGPTVHKLGLGPWLSTQVGLEVSPLDYGHFVGFPLRFDENADLNGAFHWRRDFPGATPDWKNLTMAEIFSNLRERAEIANPVVFIAHFYDNFTFYGVDPFTLELPALSITAMFNPVLMPAGFSGDFDALEALNGKNFDVIRRPTWKEVRSYNVGLAKLLARDELSYDEILRRWALLSSSAQRDFIHRTPDEQRRTLSFSNLDFQCRCSADEECGVKSLCDRATGGCVPGCTSDRDCQLDLIAAGREACLPKDAADPSRRTCQRLAKDCRQDLDCATLWGKSRERCLPGAGGASCQLVCEEDDDCADADALRSVCDVASGRCAAKKVTPANDADPCPTLRGTLDDWFLLLNRGVRRPILGNSDSHGLYSVEAGIPRNYVRSPTDLPQGISKQEIARSVHEMRTFSTYGPFLEFTVDGQGLGSIVSGTKGRPVKLRIKVQSPLWFDVDRIEVYRNGELIREIAGKADCPANSADCVRAPNDRVVNYDATIEDSPPEDSWYVVLAMGLDGKTLAPVYSSTPVARLGIFELIQRLTPLLPPLRSLRTPFAPSISTVRPFAVTNPIFVDTDGDGSIAAKGPLPPWAAERDRAASSSSSLSRQPHDHRVGLGRLRSEARAFLDQAKKRGQIDLRLVRRALDSVRYICR